MRALSLTLLAALSPCMVHAASLRTAGTVSGPMVRLRDLFDGAGPAGERMLGPAPAPGSRIVVGAAQLGAIAHAYGIDWEPVSDADQAVLERPGEPLPTETVAAALRPALLAQGAGSGVGGADFSVALPFYDPPMLDAGSLPHVAVQHLAFEAATGRFSASITIETGQADPQTLRVAGNIEVSVPVVVPSRRLLAGAIVIPGDLTIQRVPARMVNTEVAQDPAQAVGMQVRHMEFPGQPLPLADLQRPNVIAKGDRVMMALALPGLDLGAVGEALTPGGIGDRISVRNPASGATLVAEVISAGQVRVEADAPPAIAPNHNAFAQR